MIDCLIGCQTELHLWPSLSPTPGSGAVISWVKLTDVPSVASPTQGFHGIILIVLVPELVVPRLFHEWPEYSCELEDAQGSEVA